MNVFYYHGIFFFVIINRALESQCQSKMKDKNRIINRKKREERERMKKGGPSHVRVESHILVILHCILM